MDGDDSENDPSSFMSVTPTEDSGKTLYLLSQEVTPGPGPPLERKHSFKLPSLPTKGTQGLPALEFGVKGQNQNQMLPSMASPDFQHTESHYRRWKIKDFENECTEVMDNVFVGGAKVSNNWDILRENGITRIVNCAFPYVENSFSNNPDMKYLSLNILDGPENDITWFICEVLKFIEAGVRCDEKTLVHCEKGVSRSCSLMAAYRMWKTGDIKIFPLIN